MYPYLLIMKNEFLLCMKYGSTRRMYRVCPKVIFETKYKKNDIPETGMYKKKKRIKKKLPQKSLPSVKKILNIQRRKTKLK